MTKPSTLWIRSFSWLVLLAKRHVASMTSQSVHRSKITAEDASIRNTTIPLSIILCIFVLSTSCPQTHYSDKIHLSQVVHMLSTSCPQVVYNLSTKSTSWQNTSLFARSIYKLQPEVKHIKYAKACSTIVLIEILKTKEANNWAYRTL